MNVLSLFDGMGCAKIALKKLGIEVNKYYSSEIDPFAIKQVKHNFPEAILLGDVTKVKAKDLDKIDLLVGGSPCQGFSFAGKMLNFNDPRSALFFEFVRIWREIKEINPNAKFLLENVNMKKEHMLVISQYLGVFPVNINSNLVSAQNRNRWYWTNIKFEYPLDRKVLFSNILEDLPFRDIPKGFYKIWGDKKRIDKGLNWVNNYKANCLTTKNSHTLQYLLNKDKTLCRLLTTTECARLQTIPEWYEWVVSDNQIYKMLGNGFTVDVIAYIFSYANFKPTKL